MTLCRKAWLTCVLVGLVSISYAQQHYAKTLLWRITGNGLQKPSYLFGTMHLTDKRLFNFGDSVYNAIEKTDGLAMEVNPDEMVAYMLNKMMDDATSGKKLQEILKGDDYKKYSARLAKKFNKPADEVTTTDVYKEKNKWMTEYMQKGEMPTFVDAYLYNIAKRQGKWLGGIEDISDQAGLLEDLVDKSDVQYLLADKKGTGYDGDDAGMEKMINTYSSQDLEAIESLTNNMSSPEKRDRIFIRRNIKMARRIDSLAALRNMFFAIGAGHLPGDSGVISLLRARGFVVEPVISDKKIASADYKFKEVEIPWVEVKDEQGLYTASMPGNPTPIKILGLLDMKFLVDIFNMAGYYTMAIVNPGSEESPDSLYKRVVTGMLKEDRPLPYKSLVKNGVEGREYTFSKEGYTIRMQLYLGNKAVYMAGMYAMKKEAATSANADKFFNSLTLNKNYSVTAKTVKYTDTIMGVGFNTPVKLDYNKQLSNSTNSPGWKISVYTGMDANTGSFIMLFSKEVEAGNFILSDSTVINQAIRNIGLQYDKITVTDTTIQGYNVKDVTGHSLKKNLLVRLYNTILGNRNILLFVVSDSAGMYSPALQNVFKTFTFLPRSGTGLWKQYSSPDNAFATVAPSAFHDFTNADGSSLQRVAYDTATATSYVVIADTLGKYAWAESDSAFWEKEVLRWKNEDSIISSAVVKNGTLAGRELLLKSKTAVNVYKRKRLVLNGNIIYELATFGDRGLLYSDVSNEFFEGFTMSAPAKPDAVFTSKASILLADLSSADSATSYQAYRAVYDAPFTAKDLPMLHQALFKHYPPPGGYSDSAVINRRLADKLATLQSPETIAFVKGKYGAFSGAEEGFKSIALDLITGIHTEESYAAFTELLQKNPLTVQPSYTVKSNLSDSLSLTTKIYPALLKLSGDTLWAPLVANITLNLLDTGFVDIKTAAVAESDFIKSARLLLPALKINEGSNYNITYLTNLLGKFKTPASLAVLQDYLAVKDKYLKKNVVKLLLQNNKPVAAPIILGLAKDIEIRRDFYDDLKEVKKQALFPAQYLTQQYFAESLLYSAASGDDDDNPPGKLTFLSKKTGKFKDKNYTFYLFRVQYGEDKDTSVYLGIAGGYTIGSTSLETTEYLSGLYYDNKYNPLKITEQFNAYLKKRESDSEEEQ